MSNYMRINFPFLKIFLYDLLLRVKKFNVESLYLKEHLPPDLDKTVTESSLPFAQLNDNSKFPFAHKPDTVPSFHASGRAGKR